MVGKEVDTMFIAFSNQQYNLYTDSDLLEERFSSR